MNELPPPGSYIREIEVDSLFGEYNYRLRPSETYHDPRVLVLYGQNGSGKTTVLKVVRSLMSTEDNGGHRSWLAKLPFQRVSIKLDNDVFVEAVRKDELTEAFKWSIRRGRVDVYSMNVRPRNGRVSMEDWDEAQRSRYDALKQELKSLISSVIYLDDRPTFYEQSRAFRQQRYITQRLPDGRFLRIPL